MVDIDSQKLFESMIKDTLSERAETYSALVEKFGPEVIEVVEDEKGKKMRKEWSEIAKSKEDNSLDSLVKSVWNTRLDLFEASIDKKTDDMVQMKVTRCVFAEIAKDIGATDWGYRLFCKDDPHMVAGFNPKIEFSRSKTLMQGDDCCDHCYKI